MAKVPSVTERRAQRALELDGWFVLRTRGHVVMAHPTKPGRVVLPNHPDDPIAPGTLRRILKDAGLTVDEFRALL